MRQSRLPLQMGGLPLLLAAGPLLSLLFGNSGFNRCSQCLGQLEGISLANDFGFLACLLGLSLVRIVLAILGFVSNPKLVLGAPVVRPDVALSIGDPFAIDFGITPFEHFLRLPEPHPSAILSLPFFVRMLGALRLFGILAPSLPPVFFPPFGVGGCCF